MPIVYATPLINSEYLPIPNYSYFMNKLNKNGKKNDKKNQENNDMHNIL